MDRSVKQTVRGWCEVGRDVNRAKMDLPRSAAAYVLTCKKALKCERRWADKLAGVAKEAPRFGIMIPHLPPSITTLHVLAHLSDDSLQRNSRRSPSHRVQSGA